MNRVSCAVVVLAFLTPAPSAAQVQIRLGDPSRTLYSELHDRLREGTQAADSVRGILAATSGKTLWPIARGMFNGKTDWNTGLLALTRIAELREPESLDTIAAWRKQIQSGAVRAPPTVEIGDLLPALRAIDLELARGQKGDLSILNDFLPRIHSGLYDLADAWIFGRLGDGAADSVATRFLQTNDQSLRIRYLTLLSFSRDTSLVPLLGRIFVAPDSFNLPLRIGMRASDGLIWIGTRRSVETLLEARAAARARGTYVDPRLNHADLDFLGSDSSAVVSRTGRWLTEWLGVLPQ
jgi:hypothetical protein